MKKGLLAIGGLGLLAYLSANAKTDEQKADIAALGFTGTGDATVEDVIQALKGSSALRGMLKGEQGATGATGATGAAGTPGAAGDSIQNYCNSLLKNGALERLVIDGWTGAVISATGFEGMNVLENTGTTATNTNKFYVNPQRLYKFEAYVKGTATVSFVLTSFAKDNTTQLLKTNGSSSTYFLQAITPSSSVFEKKTAFCGGIGIVGTNFPPDVVFAKFAVSTSGTAYVSKLIITQVSLGEPVPYNLAFLPDGQVVYDPTTGAIGRYNGTAVVW